jgi:putative membrane-bound dehydrogenase-like protein
MWLRQKSLFIRPSIHAEQDSTSSFAKRGFLGHSGVMKFGLCLCLVFLAGGLPAAQIVITTNQASTNSPGRTNLAVAGVRTNAFKGIRIKPGFRVELVAAEPMVVNPTAMAFDENGRLFVLETPEGQPGRVRVLEDTSGTGVFDTSQIYADNVYAPTALACYDGGVFVGASGQIIYLKDSRKDGEADVRRVVFSSFGDATNGANGAVVFTAIIWGRDNRFHVGTAGRGGDIISSSSPKQSVVLSAGCFSFDPRTLAVTDESGSAPSGMAFDNRGRKFVSYPAEHLLMVMYEARYARRNPFFEMPGALADISSSETIYPTIPSQPSPGQFVAATGLMFYRGYLFPLDYVENPFVADALAAVVHRDKIRGTGIRPLAERAADEQPGEFLSVSDNSFVPTTFAGGPEGALYIGGPAREAAITIAPGKAKTNAAPSRGFGRIYRVVPVGFKQPPTAQLGKFSVTNLVNTLRHSDGWHRDSAARLLYERQNKAAVVPLIQLLFDAHAPALGHMYALNALDGLQSLVPGHLIRGLNDLDERVREEAVLLSEKMITNGQAIPGLVWEPLQNVSGDPSPQVRYQLALTLGQCGNQGRVRVLADTLRSDPANFWLQTAVLSSLGEGAGEMFGLLGADGNFRNATSGPRFLERLARMIGERNRPDEVMPVMRTIAAMPEADLAYKITRRLGDGLQAAGSSLGAADPQGILQPVYASATRSAVDINTSWVTRAEGVRLLDAVNAWQAPVSIILFRTWAALPAQLQSDFFTAMCSRPDRTSAVVVGLQLGQVPVSYLSPFQIRFLLTQPDETVRRQATAILGNPPLVSRKNIVDQYAVAASAPGVAERGRALFVARCGACHHEGNEGDSLGMGLENLARANRESLLAKIVDPNRNITPNNSAVLIVTGDGQTLAGNIIARDARGYTLCGPNGEIRVVGRQNLRSQTSLGVSAMPEGLESGMSQQDMADLLEFLISSSTL